MTWCTNCSSKIEKGNQSTLFTFNLDNTPNYACLKSDCKEACLGCGSVVLHEKGLYDCYVSDLGGSFFTFANIRPNAKAHYVMSSKKHIKDVRFMNINEWNEILPVLKDTMKKIDKVYPCRNATRGRANCVTPLRFSVFRRSLSFLLLALNPL